MKDNISFKKMLGFTLVLWDPVSLNRYNGTTFRIESLQSLYLHFQQNNWNIYSKELITLIEIKLFNSYRITAIHPVRFSLYPWLFQVLFLWCFRTAGANEVCRQAARRSVSATQNKKKNTENIIQPITIIETNLALFDNNISMLTSF